MLKIEPSRWSSWPSFSFVKRTTVWHGGWMDPFLRNETESRNTVQNGQTCRRNWKFMQDIPLALGQRSEASRSSETVCRRIHSLVPGESSSSGALFAVELAFAVCCLRLGRIKSFRPGVFPAGAAGSLSVVRKHSRCSHVRRMLLINSEESNLVLGCGLVFRSTRFARLRMSSRNHFLLPFPPYIQMFYAADYCGSRVHSWRELRLR